MKLPELIYLEDYGGDFASYMQAVYSIFRNDFVTSKPFFQGKKLALKKYPIVDDKEYTFYHFTHSGKVESERTPDIRRMERISYPKFLIENSTSEVLKVWKNKRHGKNRILIYHEEEEYLVVLDDRKDYILPWTAFLITYPNQRRKYLKEYEAYIKSQNRSED